MAMTYLFGQLEALGDEVAAALDDLAEEVTGRRAPGDAAGIRHPDDDEMSVNSNGTTGTASTHDDYPGGSRAGESSAHENSDQEGAPRGTEPSGRRRKSSPRQVIPTRSAVTESAPPQASAPAMGSTPDGSTVAPATRRRRRSSPKELRAAADAAPSKNAPPSLIEPASQAILPRQRKAPELSKSSSGYDLCDRVETKPVATPTVDGEYLLM